MDRVNVGVDVNRVVSIELIPSIFRIIVLAVIFMSTIGSAVADTEKKQYPALPFSSDFGGSFKLTDHTGQIVTDRDFLGQYVILYFGYTQCADVCPMVLFSIGQALKKIEPVAGNITPLFVNLDPDRSSLIVMKQYVHNFHPRFIGLTGSEREISRAAGAYGIRYRYVKDDNGMTRMEHSGKIFFIGPNGEVLTYFPHEASVDWIATVMERYVRSSLDQ